VTTIFGDGTRAANYIAVDDVAAFAVTVLERPEVVNEVIDVGGPSNVSLNDLAGLLETRMGVPSKRRHIPVIAMQVLPVLVKPFNELTARLISVGLYAATRATPFPEWRKAADRFGVMPRTVEEYIAAKVGKAG
jgi:NADH dehydrogenase